jgi:hypothetical protein
MGSLNQEQSKIAYHGLLNTCIFVIKAKKLMVILKLDFEKAFKKIEHKAMIEIMKAKGSG